MVRRLAARALALLSLIPPPFTQPPSAASSGPSHLTAAPLPAPPALVAAPERDADATIAHSSGGSPADRGGSSGSAPEDARQAAPANPHRPKLALVLSGGGARGAAEIGVLKVLEELHVPVDLIAGTSIGAIVGGLYATGWSPARMEDLLVHLNWGEIFVDRPARDDRSFRRKQDDAHFLIPLKMRFKNWKPYLPPGVLGGQNLELLLHSLEIVSTGERDFDRFPIPYRAIAADVATGEAVVIRKGSLAMAMRASMSIPGAFPPAEIDGRKLVDGGAASNLPIRAAQDEGADHVIAVDITTPLYEVQKITSFLAILDQQSSFLTVGNRLEDLKRLRPGDIVIRPDLGEISFVDFPRVREAVAIGEKAARAVSDRLREYAVGDTEWAAYSEHRRMRPTAELVVDRVRVENSSWVDDRIVEKRIHLPAHQPFDEEAVRRDIHGLSGLDYFGIVRDDLDREEGEGLLTIQTPPKPYGRNSLQFGLSLRDDFQGYSDYSISVRHLLLAANRLGGEWENVVQIGSTAVVSTGFYQPLDYGMRWFAESKAEYRRQTIDIWEDARAIANFRLRVLQGTVDLGRVLGNWGELRAGVFVGDATGNVRIGSPTLPHFNERDGGAQAIFRIDTLDSTIFPRHGVGLEASYVRALDWLGADVDFRQIHLVSNFAWTFGRNTLLPGIEIGDNLKPSASLGSAFFLGGGLRLSGLAENELIGARIGLARIIYYRELTKLDLGVLSQRLYAGLSAEAGNIDTGTEPISIHHLRHGGAVFLGAETVLGPVDLAYGFGDGGRRRAYLVIGHRF